MANSWALNWATSGVEEFIWTGCLMIRRSVISSSESGCEFCFCGDTAAAVPSADASAESLRNRFETNWVVPEFSLKG